MFCPRASPSLQTQEPMLQFCRRQVFHHKLRNQGCSFTRDWIGAVASRCFSQLNHKIVTINTEIWKFNKTQSQCPWMNHCNWSKWLEHCDNGISTFCSSNLVERGRKWEEKTRCNELHSETKYDWIPHCIVKWIHVYCDVCYVGAFFCLVCFYCQYYIQVNCNAWLNHTPHIILAFHA